MSDRSSRASAASISASSAPVCASCGNASQTSSAAAYLRSIGRTFPATTTCETCGAPDGTPWRPSMSYAADSRAKTSASPGRAQGSPAPGRVFGASSPVSLANYDPDTCSWKTFQLCLLGDSAESLLTWPRSGMTRNGTAYQLQPSAPLTGGTGSGSWPTPGAMDATARSVGRADTNGRHALALAMLANSGALTTPDPDQAVELHSQLLKAHGTKGSMWPTPTVSDSKGPTPNLQREGSPNLAERVAAERRGGQLNPTWVEWLLGFPAGWTDLGVSETRSSRKSPNGSEDES